MYMYKWEDLAKLAKLKQELWSAARDHDVVRFRQTLCAMNDDKMLGNMQFHVETQNNRIQSGF